MALFVGAVFNKLGGIGKFPAGVVQSAATVVRAIIRLTS